MEEINLKSIIGQKPYRQMVYDQQQGKPVDYRDLLKNKINPEGGDSGGSISQTVLDSQAAGSSSTTTSIYNPATVVSTGTITFTGGAHAIFGSGRDGAKTLSGDESFALQDFSIIKNYTDLTLNGYTLSTSLGQACCVIFVSGTLSLGSGGIIKHSGNTYQHATGSSADHYATDAIGSIAGGSGQPEGGCLWVFARKITGSGTISANGVAGGAGETMDFSGGAVSPGVLPGKTYARIMGQLLNQSGAGVVAPTVSATLAGKAGGVCGLRTNNTTEIWYQNGLLWIEPWPRALHQDSTDNTDAVSWESSTTSGKNDGRFTHLFTGQAGASGGYGGTAGAPFGLGGAGGGAGGAGVVGIDGGSGGAGGTAPGGTADVSDPADVGCGGGGGGGGAGGVCMVRCAQNETTQLYIQANGGAGGNAGACASRGSSDTGSASAGGSGGGGGGAGGFCGYEGPAGTSTTVTADGGTGGSGAAGASVGTGGVDGGPGAAGEDGDDGYCFDGRYTISVVIS